MKPELHLAKAKRFLGTVEHLDEEDDFEAIMWASMHICTHWINAIFHAKGLTAEDYDFEHTWRLGRCPDPDRLQAGLDGRMQELLDAMAVFEALRTAYVRGPGPFGPLVLGQARAHFERVRRAADETFAEA